MKSTDWFRLMSRIFDDERMIPVRDKFGGEHTLGTICALLERMAGEADSGLTRPALSAIAWRMRSDEGTLTEFVGELIDLGVFEQHVDESVYYPPLTAIRAKETNLSRTLSEAGSLGGELRHAPAASAGSKLAFAPGDREQLVDEFGEEAVKYYDRHCRRVLERDGGAKTTFFFYVRGAMRRDQKRSLGFFEPKVSPARSGRPNRPETIVWRNGAPVPADKPARRAPSKETKPNV